MNDQIFETVVTTLSPDAPADADAQTLRQHTHVAPMGVRYRGDEVVLMPFKPSTTLANILAQRSAVLNIVTDTRVFAGCVTGRRRWPVQPTEHVRGARLEAALRHVELQLIDQQDDDQRPTLRLRRVHERQHAPFIGFNRAQAAVLEASVLVSRLKMLPAEKIEREMEYLQIAIEKTAGPGEREAWGWLVDAVERHWRRTGLLDEGQPGAEADGARDPRS